MKHHERFKTVAFHCHHKPEKAKIEKNFIRKIIRLLFSFKVKKFYGDDRSCELLEGGIHKIQPQQRYDLHIAIGGDGTILKIIRNIQKEDGLILGINFGTLGFLSVLNPNNALQFIEKIIQGEFLVDERLLLKVLVYRKNKKDRKRIGISYALNEVTIGHGALSRLTNFHIKANRRFLSTYRSDGVIFATPTGSTAYSLSAGGPILSPDIHGICITPVSPHTLTHRPIVLPADCVFHTSFDARAEYLSMTVDGQFGFTLRGDDELVIQKATRKARFIRLKDAQYFKTLRNKLHWGIA